nr:MAG TPA: hypothetical protein [Bacteriophage sp.]
MWAGNQVNMADKLRRLNAAKDGHKPVNAE